MSAAVEISPERRAVLAGLAETMLPGGSGQPSASEIDLAGRQLDAVLAARPDLHEPLAALLDRLAGVPVAEAIEQVRAVEDDRDLLGLVVIGGYTMAPAVRESLGYPGQEAKIVNPFDINEVVEDGLLDPVIERGPIYREIPS
jgi:hypothetical protein